MQKLSKTIILSQNWTEMSHLFASSSETQYYYEHHSYDSTLLFLYSFGRHFLSTKVGKG